MTEPNQPMPEVGMTTNTAKLVTDGDKVAVEVLLDATRLDRDRQELLIMRALTAAGEAQRDVECMEDADVKKAVTEQRNPKMWCKITETPHGTPVDAKDGWAQSGVEAPNSELSDSRPKQPTT